MGGNNPTAPESRERAQRHFDETSSREQESEAPLVCSAFLLVLQHFSLSLTGVRFIKTK